MPRSGRQATEIRQISAMVTMAVAVGVAVGVAVV
jgi:hypothetical protein